MKHFIWVALIILVLAGCKPWWNVEDDYDPIFSEIPHPFFFPPSAASPVAICDWMCANIDYHSDDIHDELEYWQSPDQTFVWRSGDCEDYTVLGMYLIRQEVGEWPRLALGRYVSDNGEHGGHAWIEYVGRWYEAQTGRDVTDDYHYQLRELVPYGEAMWRSMNTHKSMMSEE
jgi:hypothetical protein